MDKITTICDACGTSYVITCYKDRCTVCCPKPDDDESDDYDLVDEVYDDDD